MASVYNTNTPEQRRGRSRHDTRESHEALARGAPDRWFDPWLSPNGPALSALIGDIQEALEANETRCRKRKPEEARAWRRAVEVVVCNLASTALSNSPASIVIPLAHRAWKRSRYAAYGFGRDTLHATLAAMHGEFLELRKGDERGRASSIRPTDAFVREVSRRGIVQDDIVRGASLGEVVILTGDTDCGDERHSARTKRSGRFEKRKRSWLEYDDTPMTNQYREEMRALNEYLARANLGFIPDGCGEVRLSERTMRRHFHQLPGFECQQWECGGRLYGSFWCYLERERRRNNLLIDGEPCAEVDYSALHLRLASASVGVELSSDEDPYALDGLGREHRGSLKVMVNAMMTARGGLKKKPPLARLASGLADAGSLPRGWPVARVRRAMVAKYQHLEAFLGERAKNTLPPGYALQFRESCILLSALREFMGLGVTALGLHDGVLVARSKAGLAQGILERAALAHGLRVPVGVK